VHILDRNVATGHIREALYLPSAAGVGESQIAKDNVGDRGAGARHAGAVTLALRLIAALDVDGSARDAGGEEVVVTVHDVADEPPCSATISCDTRPQSATDARTSTFRGRRQAQWVSIAIYI
jgi:hypothetical protein